MRSWTDPGALREAVLDRLRRMGWSGDARLLEDGRRTPDDVAGAFEALSRSATAETVGVARDLRRLSELEAEEEAAA